MPASLYIFLTVLTILSVLATQRLAKQRGRKPLPWMIAATILGPLPLIPLALSA
jgi:hypothetical protein